MLFQLLLANESLSFNFGFWGGSHNIRGGWVVLTGILASKFIQTWLAESEAAWGSRVSSSSRPSRCHWTQSLLKCTLHLTRTILLSINRIGSHNQFAGVYVCLTIHTITSAQSGNNIHQGSRAHIYKYPIRPHSMIKYKY